MDGKFSKDLAPSAKRIGFSAGRQKVVMQPCSADG
jgi:hypothetical protein